MSLSAVLFGACSGSDDDTPEENGSVYVTAVSSESHVINFNIDAKICSNVRICVSYTGLTPTVYTDYVVRGETNHYLPLPRSCGLNGHIEQADFPETHEAFLQTSWGQESRK